MENDNLSKRERIASWCRMAREYVRLGNAKAANEYLTMLLDEALRMYNEASTILAKVRYAAFRDEWLKVSDDLRTFGITDYVLESFCLKEKTNDQKPVAVSPAPKHPAAKPLAPNPSVPKPPAQDRDFQGWSSQVFEKNKLCVVRLFSRDWFGTGFIISDKGYLLTNHHVVYDKSERAFSNDMRMCVCGSDKDCAIEVVRADSKRDVALCRFDPKLVGEFKVAEFAEDYSAVRQGADCVIIGNAFGQGIGPFTGVIRQTKDQDDNLVYTAPSNPGDSGSPVFTRNGKCIGIHKSTTTKINGESVKGFSNATPADYILKFIDKCVQKDGVVL